jgi:hypothetical protein
MSKVAFVAGSIVSNMEIPMLNNTSRIITPHGRSLDPRQMKRNPRSN